MKVKIRGLVFVGFAAAVFAQSAMADANDAKTVTSKLYVDSTFQTKENIVTTTEAGANGFDWTSETTYPSVALLNQVKSQVTGIDVNGDETYITVADGTGNDAGKFTVSPKLTPATANSDITGDLTDTSGTTIGTKHKLVTAGAVKSLMDTGLSDATNAEDNTTVPTSLAVVSYAEKKANKATAIITSGTGQNNTTATDGDVKYPTTKAVYDFVTSQVGGAAYQRKLTSDDTGTLYVGQYDSSATGDKSTWKQIGTKGYLTYAQNGTSGVYEFDINSAQIADSVATDSSQKLVTENAVYDLVDREGTSGTTTITASASETQVPTSRNVYDFVNGNYQPKTTTQGVMTGYNGTWHTLGGDSTYITVADNGNAASVTLGNLTAHGVAGGGGTTGVDPYTSDFVTGGTKLARSGDVYDFVMDQMGGLAIPEMPTECVNAISANNGHYCALVAGYSATAANNVGLEWTIMAPTN